jgi:hypothetical protein
MKISYKKSIRGVRCSERCGRFKYNIIPAEKGYIQMYAHAGYISLCIPCAKKFLTDVNIIEKLIHENEPKFEIQED